MATITDITLSQNTVADDAPVGTTVGTFLVTMSDGTPFTGTIALSGPYASMFSVVQTRDPYSITAIALDDPNVAANVPAGALVGNLSVTLSDGQPFAGTLTVNDTAHFAISGSALVTSAVLTAANYPITITATDNSSANRTISTNFQIVAVAAVQVPGPLTALASPTATTTSITVGWAAPTTGGLLDHGVHQIQWKPNASSTWNNLAPVLYCTISSGSITDAFGNVWTINPTGSPNQGEPNAVMCNGVYANGYNSPLMYLVAGLVYHGNSSGNWFSFTPTGTVNGTTVAWTQTANTPPITSPGLTVSGLTANSTYNFRGYATNSAGQGPTTTAINPTTLQAPPPGQQAPAQAAAVGYTNLMVNADFTSPSQVTSDQSGNTVTQLYAWNNFEPVPITGYSVSNGVLTITQTTRWGWGISTACSNSAPISTPTARATNTGRGLIFRYGYFEADIGFDFTSSTVFTFWLNYVTGTSIELDVMELFGNPISAIHEWTSPGGSSPDLGGGGTDFGGPQSAVVRNTNSGGVAWNKYGFLWTPNTMQVFINDRGGPIVDCNQTFGWNTFGGNLGPPYIANGTINVFGGANRGGSLPQMGIWNGSSPQYCRMFRVWQ